MSKTGFYDSRAWRKVRREVMRLDNNECQCCKERHRHSAGQLVHHNFHLDEYPQYGLMMWVEDPATGVRRRNLITVCRECHETVCHPERMQGGEYRPLLTEERW